MYAIANRIFTFIVASTILVVAAALAATTSTTAFAAQGDAGSLVANAPQIQTLSKRFDVTNPGKIYWTGKVVQPKITVKYGGKKLKAGRDYKVVLPKSKKTGYYEFEVIGKGTYKGFSGGGYYVVGPHSRKIVSAKRSGNTLKLKWQTHPDKTDYYFVLCGKSKADISKRFARLLEEYEFWDTMETLQHSKWDQWMFMRNDIIKKKWGAGRMNINIKRYLGSSYNKKYIYVGVCPMVGIFEGMCAGKMTFKKVSL